MGQAVRSATLLAFVVAAAIAGRALGATAPPAPPAPSAANGTFADRTGIWGNAPAGRPDQTNPFFASLGSNGRTCATCHAPNDGWSVSLGGLSKRFANTGGTDPIFLPVDGTNCPTLPQATPAERQAASSLLLGRGLIRIERPVPVGADFQVSNVVNPYGCASKTTLSVYRRILPTTNLSLLSTVMWDGRETQLHATLTTMLTQQANDAVATHAQGITPAPAASIASAVALEFAQHTAQISDTLAGPLDAAGATGGLGALAQQPLVAAGNSGQAFTLFGAWEAIVTAPTPTLQAQASIGRGERIFNTRPMSLQGVAGLNDAAHPVIVGTCSTCHNGVNAGSHATPLLVDEGQAHQFPKNPDLPAITLVETATGRSVTVNDPGAALVTGHFADVGKFKVPTLRGLSAHAPYFHNGSARSLADVVAFYNTRFNLNLTTQEAADLAAFLSAL